MATPFVARVYMNFEQKRRLVEFMELHRDFATNRMSSNYPTQVRNDLWSELAEILNAEPMGVHKEVEGWKKSWKELKASVKDKVSKIKGNDQRKRGGKRMRAVPLTPLEERVLLLLGVPVPRVSRSSLESVREVPAMFLEPTVELQDIMAPARRTSDIVQDHSPDNKIQVVEAQNSRVDEMTMDSDHLHRQIHKREPSPSPPGFLPEPQVADEMTDMYFQSQPQEPDDYRESAYSRLAAAQEELVVMKRCRYQQKKEHEDAMLTVFKEFVDCVKSAIAVRK